MSGVSIAVRTRLSWLLVRRGLRSGMGRLNSHPRTHALASSALAANFGAFLTFDACSKA